MAESDVIRAMREFKQQLLARETGQMQAMSARWLALENRLSDQIELLATDLRDRRRAGLPVSPASVYRLDRYQVLLEQIRQEWSQYQGYATGAIRAGQQTFGELGISHAAAILGEMAPGITAGLRTLPAEAVQSLVGLLADGSPLASILGDELVTAGMLDGLTNTLIEGTALGWQPRKTAREMKNALTGGLNKALTVARDTQLRVYREMNRRQMLASGVVEGYQRLATRDDRTCPACLARDGEFIPLDEVMAEHTQGRCAQVPFVSGLEAPTWQKGPDWFADQSPATQKAILGPGHYQAWQDGEFNFEQLATVQADPVWGDSLQTAPLGALT